jgi:hypothetical protein
MKPFCMLWQRITHAAQACPGGPWWPRWHLADPDSAETTRRLRGDYAETDPDELLKPWARAQSLDGLLRSQIVHMFPKIDTSVVLQSPLMTWTMPISLHMLLKITLSACSEKGYLIPLSSLRHKLMHRHWRLSQLIPTFLRALRKDNSYFWAVCCIG